jgi:NitT/TauT family transport system permease protein
MAVRDHELTRLSTGLDALETTSGPRTTRGRRVWKAVWPKLLAVAIVLGFWQFLVWIRWREEYALPPPSKVFGSLTDNWSVIWDATGTTLQRGVKGYALALLIGITLGALVSRIAVLRAAIGSMITGLQTMPSVAWFPLALLLFKLSEGAITFVVVLGAAPSVANGLISGVDNIPPVLHRAGRVMGAQRIAAFWHVILPAAMPSFIGGLKQGWAFAWRSLLAAEVIGGIPGYSLGQQLQANRDLADAAGVISVMIVIFVIGVLMDTFVFGFAERSIRKRYGLVDQALAA